MSRCCHRHRPVVSTSGEKLRNVWMSTIVASTATPVRRGEAAGRRRYGRRRRPQRFQAEQDGPAQLLTKPPVDITLDTAAFVTDPTGKRVVVRPGGTPPARFTPVQRARRTPLEGHCTTRWLFCWLLWGVIIFEKNRLPVGTAGFEPATP